MFALKAALVVVLVLIALYLCWLAVERANQRPHLGILSLFVWLAVFVLFIDNPETLVVNVGGINIVGADVLCSFLAGIATLRLLQGRAEIARLFRIPLVLLVGLLLFSYARGVIAFGLQPATNEFREFFYFLSALAFTLSFKVEQLATRVPSLAVIGAALLVAVGLVRIPMMGGFGLEERAVPSYAALAMGQAFFFGWAWTQFSDGARIWRWPIFGFLLFAFLMLHRSVWVALACGFVVLLAVDRAERKSLLFAVALAGGVGGIVIALFLGDKVVDGLNQAVGEATASEGSTFMWRVEGWLALLRPDENWNIPNLLIGHPMGSGYARTLGNSVLTSNDIESGIIPHNYYVSLILRGGILGVTALVLLYTSLIKVLIANRRSPEPHVYSICFLAILVTQLVYYIPYSADMIQGVFLGGGIVFASALCLSRFRTSFAV